MKKLFIYTVLAVLGAGMLFSACENAGSAGPIGPLPPPVVMLSGLGACETQGDAELSGIGKEERLEAEVIEGKVKFTHSGANFNCCLDSISLALEAEGTEIRVRESGHASEPCFCTCDYTVYGEIADLPPGTYKIMICPPGDSGHVCCSVDVSVP